MSACTDGGRQVTAIGFLLTDELSGGEHSGPSTIDSTGGQPTRANDLQEAAKGAAKGTDRKVSVISWLGYDAPEVPVVQAPNLAVGSTSRATDGAEALRQFTQGTRAAQGDHPSHLSVFGHSYGTTLVGAAAASGAGLGADEIVAVASPGMTVERADQLHIDPSHFWTGRAADDNIALAAGLTLGEDPIKDNFGGQRFVVDTSGHSGYWDDGSHSLANQGRIIVGKPPGTVPRTAVTSPGPL
ncbi:alpha/beta hydrolase [Kitasatospora sp. NPDC089913]|uniref:alpha/beta hydrolase n=1 Tax=Kitasatospora sp. NPDC089913 TaxID=3364080 RepID=UPI0038048112